MLPSAGQTTYRLKLNRRMLLHQRLIEPSRQQAKFTWFVIQMANQVERMLRKDQLSQDQPNYQ